jgi:hypothetical protein
MDFTQYPQDCPKLILSKNRLRGFSRSKNNPPPRYATPRAATRRIASQLNATLSN